jgi:phosphatidate cytidylyltransferase
VLFAEVMLSGMKLPFEKIAVCIVSGLLIPYLLTAIVRIHGGEYGRFFILIPFVMAFLSDAGAYFIGCAYGKHKLAPNISPKKSIEGLFGGVLGGIAGMLLYCVVLQVFFSFKPNYLYAVIYGLLGSLVAVFGDLCFSVIKRQTGIKDYGNLIPGHGGALDRFDSMILVAPLAEILLSVLPLAVKV